MTYCYALRARHVEAGEGVLQAGVGESSGEIMRTNRFTLVQKPAV